MLKQTLRVALAQINTTVGDLGANAEKIVSFSERAASSGADIVSFPELAITGYPPEDLLFKKRFIADNIAVLKELAPRIKRTVVVVGFVDRSKEGIFNAAAVISGGKVRGVYRKAFLPNYGVFDEKRYFASGKSFPVFGMARTAFGVNICEDIWHLEGPAGIQAYRGARLIANINASPYHMGKGRQREEILKKQAKKHKVFITYTNLVGGQDELVFDGQSLIVDDRGRIIARAASFCEELLVADVEIPAVKKKTGVYLQSSVARNPDIQKPRLHKTSEVTQEVYEALVLGLKDYMAKNGFKKAVMGLSGGIDSALVAAIASDSVGPSNVLGVSMPSSYTSNESEEDAQILARQLGIGFKRIPIGPLLERYLESLVPVFEDKKADVTEENLQARIRGNLIMALSNKFGYLALNTGNKSEVSCGYCTLYGDMAGGFGVIKDVPKMLVYQLAAFKNKKEGRAVIPERIFEKPPSAELRPNQKDSDSLPEYDLLDPALRLYVEEDKSVDEMVRSGIDRELIRRIVHLVDSNEYKRRQAPPGIKITPKAFGRDRRMPITNRYR